MAKLEAGSRVRVEWPETVDEKLHEAEGVVVKSWDKLSLVSLDRLDKDQWVTNNRLVTLT